MQGRNRDAAIENGHGTWGYGESGTNWEYCTDTHTLPHVNQMTRGKLPYNMGSSARCPVMTWGWRVVERETAEEGYIQLIHTVVRQKPRQHCKAIKLQQQQNPESIAKARGN